MLEKVFDEYASDSDEPVEGRRSKDRARGRGRAAPAAAGTVGDGAKEVDAKLNNSFAEYDVEIDETDASQFTEVPQGFFPLFGERCLEMPQSLRDKL